MLCQVSPRDPPRVSICPARRKRPTVTGSQLDRDFQVTPAEYLELSELTPAQLARARITVGEGPDGLPLSTSSQAASTARAAADPGTGWSPGGAARPST